MTVIIQCTEKTSWRWSVRDVTDIYRLPGIQGVGPRLQSCK